MNKIIPGQLTSLVIAVLFFMVFNFCFSKEAGGAVKVQIIQDGTNFTLLRGGKPYYIKGANMYTQIECLRDISKCGGNSVRACGIEQTGEVLKVADSFGLTVIAAFWIEHERHGFNYDDERQVHQQYIAVSNFVEKYKNNPAVLIWGMGNEVNLNYSNRKVWNAINDIAAMIHRIDPNHPVMTVVNDFSGETIRQIMARAPEIDILGINSYGGIGGIGSSLERAGWNKSVIITEWGPNGDWENGRTSWGAPIEPTGAEKSFQYESRYQVILSLSNRCLGSYVFLWGQKQERTPTWYAFYLENIPALGIHNEQASAVDVMEYNWTGKWPRNRAPNVMTVTINGLSGSDSIMVKPYSTNLASVLAEDPEGKPLRYIYDLMKEYDKTVLGGDFQKRPDSLTNFVLSTRDENIEFQAPAERGYYRLFVYVFDDSGHAGMVNIPFRVGNNLW